MRAKKRDSTPTDKELQLLEQLRKHPDLRERFESILNLANAEDGPLKTADEVEELLIEQVRKLGNQTMTNWAASAEERVSQELKHKEPSLRSRKKKL